MVDRSLRPASGDVIIASVDGDFTVKTYRRDKDGVRLEPANPAYSIIYIKKRQVLDYFGKVTACIHQFNKPTPVPHSPFPVPSSLYKAVDALNAKYGKGKVFSAAEGIGKKSWHMKRQKLTPRPTTRWDELIVAR